MKNFQFPRSRIESLLVSAISKASANQRSGRAGRTRPGKCFRLYTENAFDIDLEDNSYPEILRSNLAKTALTLKKIGVKDLVHFDYMDPPAPETMMRAFELLNYLGALDDKGEITDVGQIMADFPVDPQLAKTVITSPQFNCSQEIVNLAALLTVPNVFLRPKEAIREADEAKAKFYHPDGDHLTLLNAFHTYQTKQLRNENVQEWAKQNFLNFRAFKNADDIRQQLTQLMTKYNLALKSTSNTSSAYSKNIRKCLLSGYFTQVAHLQSTGNYLTIQDKQQILIHPSSGIDHKPKFVVYHEIVLTKKNYIRTCTEIKPEWLLEIQPQYFTPSKIKWLETREALEKVEREVIENKKKGMKKSQFQ